MVLFNVDDLDGIQQISSMENFYALMQILNFANTY